MAYNIKSLFGLGLFLVLVSPVTYSLEMAVDLYTDLEYSTNVEAVSFDTQNELTQVLGMNVELQEKRKRFNVDGSFNLEEEHYYQDTFNNSTSLTTGFGVFNLDVIEEFLNWRTAYTRTKVLSRFEDNETPSNYEQREITRTGPAITYRMSEIATLSVLANYIFVENTEEEVADTKRANTSLNYIYALSPIMGISLNSNYDEILDAEGDEEIKNANYNVGISREVSNGRLSFNYGRTRSWSDISKAVESNFFDVSFVRRQFYWHDVTLRYYQDLSDTSIGFEIDEEGFLQDLEEGESVQVSAANNTSDKIDIIKRKRLTGSVGRVIGSYRYILTGFWDSEAFQLQENDKKSRGFNIALTKNIIPNFDVGFSYDFALTDYIDRPDLGKGITKTFRLNSQFGISERIGLGGFIQFKGRQNSRDQSREFEELSTGVSIKWALL